MSASDRAILNIGHLPGRRQPALWIEEGSVIRPLAYFRGEDAFERFRAVAGGANELRWIPDDEED